MATTRALEPFESAQSNRPGRGGLLTTKDRILHVLKDGEWHLATEMREKVPTAYRHIQRELSDMNEMGQVERKPCECGKTYKYRSLVCG